LQNLAYSPALPGFGCWVLFLKTLWRDGPSRRRARLS